MSYPVPAEQLETLLEIKKSKFYACAGFADSRESAMAMLDTVKARYPDARHHCWAYILGNPHSAQSAAMSDDGEPSGTAGKPILNVLQHKGVGDIMLIVTRYFGGIKLGAGGLVRAYSGAAQQTMEQLATQTQEVLECRVIEGDFKHEQYLRHWAQQHGGHVDDCQYSNKISLSLRIPATALSELDALAGSLHLTIAQPV